VGLKLTSQEVRPPDGRAGRGGEFWGAAEGAFWSLGAVGHGLQGQRSLLVWKDKSGQHVCPEAVGCSHSESRSQTT
jgi:hypothetical protein